MVVIDSWACDWLLWLGWLNHGCLVARLTVVVVVWVIVGADSWGWLGCSWVCAGEVVCTCVLFVCEIVCACMCDCGDLWDDDAVVLLWRMVVLRLRMVAFLGRFGDLFEVGWRRRCSGLLVVVLGGWWWLYCGRTICVKW